MQLAARVPLRTYLSEILVQIAPVLAGLKPSAVLTVRPDCIAALRQLLSDSGLKLYTLFGDAAKATLFFYRENELLACVKQHSSFLDACGYHLHSLQSVLGRLRSRFLAFHKKLLSFPHELGIFLGYPLCDVTGFIENGGKNELYAGHWKVYGNLDSTLAVFRRMDAVMNMTAAQAENGVPLERIVFACCHPDLSRAS